MAPMSPFIGATVMEKEIRKFLTCLSILGLLASCAETGTVEAGNDNASIAAQGAGTFVVHDEFARRYESRASKLLEIAAEHEKRLQYSQYYKDKSYYSGRNGQNSQLRASALVQKYRRAAEKATEAAFHRRMASQLAGRDYIASGA